MTAYQRNAVPNMVAAVFTTTWVKARARALVGSIPETLHAAGTLRYTLAGMVSSAAQAASAEDRRMDRAGRADHGG
ncbi:hypothetical protein GCM10022275_13370 [Tessaracoccus defluvii]